MTPIGRSGDHALVERLASLERRIAQNEADVVRLESLDRRVAELESRLDLALDVAEALADPETTVDARARLERVARTLADDRRAEKAANPSNQPKEQS